MIPIRFQCQSCSQPIEVDEEWADKTVACPYCKTTVTAPTQTTLTELDQIHSASPVSTPEMGSNYSVQHHTPLEMQNRNIVAVVALALAILLIVLFVISAIMVTPHQMEMEQIQEMYQKSDKSTNSQMQIIKDLSDQYGGEIPGWFIAVAMFQIIAIPIFLAAVICGIIGVRRRYRKHLAIISLAICSGMFLFFAFGVMFSL